MNSRLTAAPQDRSDRRWPAWRWLLTGLCALGLALSGYLSWHVLTGEAVIGCTGGSPCEQVLNSRWATIAGVVPVSGLAVGAYLALLVASLFVGRGTAPEIRRLAWQALLLLAGAAAGSALWFVIVQRWFIGAFCPYCLATHLTSVVLALVVLRQSRREFPATLPVPEPEPQTTAAETAGGARRGSPRWLALVGLGLAAGMAVVQVRVVPAGAYRAGETNAGPAGLDFRTAPRIGAVDAPYVVCLLFDYACPHCQQLHFLLEDATRRYGGKLAFVLCPTPLDHACNPYVSPATGAFKDSCELARIALAVWVADHDAFREFDTWMFSVESGDAWEPRTAEAARAQAVALVGRAKFDAARSDPWIERTLQGSIRLFGEAGGKGVPKFVFGSRWVIPQPNDTDDLLTLLQTRLGVPKP